MKVKWKKIVSRVGAMVAAVLLVALCALPAFADEEVSLIKWTVEDINNEIIKEYELESYGSAAWFLFKEIDFDYDVHKVIWQFSPRGTDWATDWHNTFQNLKTQEYPEWGSAVIRDKTDNKYIYYEKCYITSSYTTSGTSRYIYLDLYVSVDGGYNYERELRIRWTASSADGSFTEVKVTEGSWKRDDATTLEIAFAGGEYNAKALEYALSRDLIGITDNVNIRWWNFYRGIHSAETGYLKGYNDGINQTSLLDGVTAIFRAPMELINSVLNFEVLGINMAVAVRVLISMAILGVVITFIWKAVK